MKIKKTDLTTLIKEELTAFYVTPNAFAQQKQNEADDSPKATGDKAAWKKYFNKTWDEFKKKNNLPTDAEVKDLAKLSSELKKQFYNTVDAGWTSKEEKASKSKQESISILDDEIDEPQLVVTEGFKVGQNISKALAKSSTIKMANPTRVDRIGGKNVDPGWIFAIISRFGSKGASSAAAQDKVSMVVVDKAGKVIKDWGSHVNVKKALTFAQSKGYKKKISKEYKKKIGESENVPPLENIVDEAIRMSNEPRHMPARGYKGRAKKNHQEWVRKVHGLLPKNKVKSLDQLKVNQLYDYGSSPEDAAKALLKKENSDVDSLKPNDPSKKILQELKFVVRISGVGSVVIDGSSEGDVRTRLVKKLRGGKKSIESITRIAKDKAKRAEKNLGIAVVGDVAIDHSVDESKLNEANPADVKRMFAKQLSHVNKLMSIIKQSLGYLEKRHKGDPGNVQNLLFLSGIKNKLSNVEQDINKFPRK